ncbi:NlpC/P60 family protein [Streptomyces sp. RB6PN25]|uniref:NlpC/P60 family protein n=1 Tax=Streptomyces humicola TaxID=2953240 RepID=A0ABT1PWW4_9ACTN|nr:C40 family peptidase [Streptomyces humicola]MCQ4081578.1 NlpC/P60 family protein [Streptomyces humicola]
MASHRRPAQFRERRTRAGEGGPPAAQGEAGRGSDGGERLRHDSPSAEPERGSPRGAGGGSPRAAGEGRRSERSHPFATATPVAALSAAVATAAALTSAVPAGAAAESGPDAIKSRLDTLYEQAEQATEKFDAAQEQEAQLRGEIDALQGQVARSRQAVNRLLDGLAAVATAQYQQGGIDPMLVLLLSSNPSDYLERAADLDRIDSEQAAELHQLRAAERALAQERAEAAAKLADLERVRAALAAHKRIVEQRLKEAERLLGALTDKEQAALGFGPDGRMTGIGRLPDLPDLGPSSSRAAAAVAAAESAVGLPYAWGAAGPDAFDCSGLMYWAYEHAGVMLPRTSQGQLGAGQRVPLSQIRPGDLVIYRDNASHVGMYVGGGRVVHAPYPGARVRYDPVDMMPIAGVTRI